jgi:hypothetical protein
VPSAVKHLASGNRDDLFGGSVNRRYLPACAFEVAAIDLNRHPKIRVRNIFCWLNVGAEKVIDIYSQLVETTYPL